MPPGRVIVLGCVSAIIIGMALAMPMQPVVHAQLDPTIAKAQSDILRRQGEIEAARQAALAEQRRIAQVTAQARETAMSHATETAIVQETATAIASATMAHQATETRWATQTQIAATATAQATATQIAGTSTARAATAQATATQIAATATRKAVEIAEALEQDRIQKAQAAGWIRLIAAAILLLLGGTCVIVFARIMVTWAWNKFKPAKTVTVYVPTAQVLEPAGRPMTTEEKQSAVRTFGRNDVEIGLTETDYAEAVEIVEHLRQFGARPAEPVQ